MRKLTLILFLLITSNSFSQWFQLPNLPVSGTVRQMTFANANTGWIVVEGPTKTIKTTDGGMSWNIVVNNGSILLINFLNENLGYAIDISGKNFSKTTNGGLNWSVVSTTSNIYMNLYFANQDTGWVCGTDGNLGKIWRTTNGGQTFTLHFTAPTGNLTKLFFLKDKLNGEYVGWANYQTYFTRTINSGANWASLPISISGVNCGGSSDFAFRDTANGVNLSGSTCFSRTTNGGYNWFNGYQPHFSSGARITTVNSVCWVSLSADSIIKTSNFFQTYGKQKLPTPGTSRLYAVDSMIVYGVANQNNVIKTTNGGGEIVVTVNNNSETINNYFLHQNYPNPFNPNTIINYQIAVNSFVLLKVYDIRGKGIQTLTDRQQAAGNYSVQFDGANLPSGVYYYKLETENFTETRKMVLLK